jgi:hypothetical protein
MENVKSSTTSNLQVTQDLDQLIEDGRKLHSEAVFIGISKFFTLFRHDIPQAVQIKEKQGKLKYSH